MLNYPRVLVLSNCTHVGLKKGLDKIGMFALVDSLGVYSLQMDQFEVIADQCAKYDYILTVSHGHKYGPLSTDALRSRYMSKVISFPTPFFSGLFPDMAYLKYQGEIVRANGVMGDYHSALILEDVRAGYSECDVVKRYESCVAFQRVDIKGIWGDSIDELKSREIGVEILISEYIKNRCLSGQIVDDFLSFNHPTENLINHIVHSFCSLVLGRSFEGVGLLADEHDLYHDVYWPVAPIVSEVFGLPVSINQTFKAPDRLGGARMSRAEFALASFRFFTGASSANGMQIVTPAFLPGRIDVFHRPIASSACERSQVERRANSGFQSSNSRMKNNYFDRIVLHIGTEKTGTTAIQKFLHINREALRTRGVVVPMTLGGENHWLLPGIFCETDALEDMFRLLRLPTRDMQIAERARWKSDFSNELEATVSCSNALIVSSELLQSRLKRKSELIALAEFFYNFGKKIHIILYIRSPLSTAVSLYSTAVKNGATSASIPGPENSYFRDVVDHAQTIRLWNSVFPRECITVRIYDQSDLPLGGVIDDFIQSARLPMIEFRKPDLENKSLSALGIELLRRVNMRVPLFLSDGTPNPARHGLVSFFESHFSAGRRYTPNADTVGAYNSAFFESLSWVCENFFPERQRLFLTDDFGIDEATTWSNDIELQQISDAFVDMWLISRHDNK